MKSPLRKIDLVVIHCSDSPNGRPVSVRDIDAWHRERGFKRMDNWRARQNSALTSIGYHFVLYADGTVATGRHIDEIGAHAHCYNATSIGICLVGRDAFGSAQWNALKGLVGRLQSIYPQARVVGHRDLTLDKTCPNFDVAAWLDNGAPINKIFVPGASA